MGTVKFSRKWGYGLVVEGIGGKREEQGQWKANIDDLSTSAESHLEDGASVPSRKARIRHIRHMETASLETEGRNAKDGMNTGMMTTERGYLNAIPQY